MLAHDTTAQVVHAKCCCGIHRMRAAAAALPRAEQAWCCSWQPAPAAAPRACVTHLWRGGHHLGAVERHQVLWRQRRDAVPDGLEVVQHRGLEFELLLQLPAVDDPLGVGHGAAVVLDGAGDRQRRRLDLAGDAAHLMLVQKGLQALLKRAKLRGRVRLAKHLPVGAGRALPQPQARVGAADVARDDGGARLRQRCHAQPHTVAGASRCGRPAAAAAQASRARPAAAAAAPRLAAVKPLLQHGEGAWPYNTLWRTRGGWMISPRDTPTDGLWRRTELPASPTSQRNGC